MSNLDLAPIAQAEFRASASYQPDTITVTVRGTADIPARAALETLLDRVHSESLRLAVKEVVLDFKELEFMNSSCFKSFVSWIELIQNLEPAAQYRVQFVSNPEMHWQRRSLKALSCFAADLITVVS